MIEIKKIAAISRENGGIHDVGQVSLPPPPPSAVCQIRQFINDMMRVLAPELSPKMLHQAMDTLGSLIPEQHSQLYSATVDKAIQFHAGTARTATSALPAAPAPRVVSGGTVPANPRQSSPSLLSSIPSEVMAQESKASKRAKMMQSSATQQVQSTSSTAKAALLSNVEGISLTRRSQSSSADSAQMKRLGCIICKESPPRNASVSPCGHVCCEKCWEGWLRVKLECPMCRVRTSPSDIARLRFAA
jgi:hypothetical protein